MHSVVKTILYCYPYFNEVADDIEELALYKAVSSHCDSSKTLAQVERVINLYEDAKILRKLKFFVEEALCELTDYEKAIVSSKYFKDKRVLIINKSKRTYYRQQQRAFEKLVAYAKRRGISEQWFIKNCYGIDCVKNVYLRILKKERNAQKNLDKRQASESQASERQNLRNKSELKNKAA